MRHLEQRPYEQRFPLSDTPVKELRERGLEYYRNYPKDEENTSNEFRPIGGVDVVERVTQHSNSLRLVFSVLGAGVFIYLLCALVASLIMVDW